MKPITVFSKTFYFRENIEELINLRRKQAKNKDHFHIVLIEIIKMYDLSMHSSETGYLELIDKKDSTFSILLVGVTYKEVYSVYTKYSIRKFEENPL